MNWFIQNVNDSNDRIPLWTGVLDTNSIQTQCKEGTYGNSSSSTEYTYIHPITLFTSAVLPAGDKTYTMMFEI
jgi:hypothetical protein